MKKKMYLAIVGWIAVLVLVLALAGCGKITDIAEDQQENDTAESAAVETEESGAQPETAAPETENASEMNSDGKYVYQIDGHELSLSIRLEDFIDGDVLDLYGLEDALGYTEGKIRDSEGNIIAVTGAPDKLQPLANLEFSINLSDESQTMSYTIHGLPETDSQILTITTFNPARHISFNQLVAAVYVWSCYSDGGIHDDPLATILSDYRSDNTKSIVYQIP